MAGEAEMEEKRRKGLPLLLGAVVIIGCLVSGGVALDLPGRVGSHFAARAAAKAAEEEARLAELRVVMPFEPLVVSLGSETFAVRRLPRLTVEVALEVSDIEAAEQARAALKNDFLSSARSIEVDTLQSPEGLETLRAVLTEVARTNLGENFHRVLITEFIVL